MSTTLISSYPLKNGLTLKFMDESRKIAADRWYIRVWVTIDIPVDKKWFSDGSVDDDRFARIADRLGDRVVFRQKKERNFISDNVKDQVVQDICDRTLETNLTYMGSDSFPAKFISKVYTEQKSRD